MKKTTTIKARRGRPPRADFGTRLIRAAHEAIAIARGEADPSTYHIHVPSDLDVRAIRLRTGLSQDKFAERFGFTRARVRDWEQGRSKPDGAVRAYLIVLDRGCFSSLIASSSGERSSQVIRLPDDWRSARNCRSACCGWACPHRR